MTPTTTNTVPPLPALEDLAAVEDERLIPALVHVAAIQGYLAARLAEASARKPRWRTVAWAHEQSGLSAPYFYERAAPDHPDRLPFLKKRGRSIRVEEAGFWRWFRRR